jgi:hypothetical protein
MPDINASFSLRELKALPEPTDYQKRLIQLLEQNLVEGHRTADEQRAHNDLPRTSL